MTREERITHFRERLHPAFTPLYDLLFEQLPIEWAPYSGFRGIMEQDQLFNKGRNLNGDIVDAKQIVTNSRGGSSPHNYGCAVDVTLFTPQGAVTWMTKNDPRWNKFGEIVSNVGLRWGGNFISLKDPGHCELAIDCAWSGVNHILKGEGEKVAYRFIEDHKI